MRAFLLAVLLCWISPSSAAERYDFSTTSTAILISNGAYQQDPIETAAGDLAALSQSLDSVGFKVQSESDLRADQIAEAFGALEKQSRKATGILLIYLKGHGWNDGHTTYFAGVDANLSSRKSLLKRSVSLDGLFRALSYSDAKAVIVVLDMCRNTPEMMRGVATGSSEMEKLIVRNRDGDRNFSILYSAAPGSVAEEGSASLSPFGSALSQTIAHAKDQSLLDIFSLTVSLARELGPEAGLVTPARPVFFSNSTGPVYINRFHLNPNIFDAPTRVASPILDPRRISLCLTTVERCNGTKVLMMQLKRQTAQTLIRRRAARNTLTFFQRLLSPRKLSNSSSVVFVTRSSRPTERATKIHPPPNSPTISVSTSNSMRQKHRRSNRLTF